MKMKIVGICICTLLVVSGISVIGINVEVENVQQHVVLKSQDNKNHLDIKPVDLSLWQAVYFDFGNLIFTC